MWHAHTVCLLHAALVCQTFNDYVGAMKTLIFAALFVLSACTLPQVIYVQQPLPSDAAYWNMPASQRWVSDPQPFPQAPPIPRWCVDPISRTNVPC